MINKRYPFLDELVDAKEVPLDEDGLPMLNPALSLEDQIQYEDHVVDDAGLAIVQPRPYVPADLPLEESEASLAAIEPSPVPLIEEPILQEEEILTSEEDPSRTRLVDLETAVGENALLKAQKERRIKLAAAGANRGSERLLSGIIGMKGGDYKPDLDRYEIDAANAQLPVTEVTEQENYESKQMTQEEASIKLDNSREANDPNSDVSKQARVLMERLTGQKLPPNLSANQIAKTSGLAQQIAKMDMDKEKLAFDKEKERNKPSEQEKADTKLKAEEAKEERKENTTIQKENRKIRATLDEAEDGLDAQLKLLKEAKAKATEFAKDSWGGTGPVANVLGGHILDKRRESLKATFQKISLDSMVKMFAGMSKAVDSNAERAAFESTQPNIWIDDDVNQEILDNKITAVLDLIHKTRTAKSKYDREGKFNDDPVDKIPVYSATQERGINRVMDAHSIPREEAIKALTEANKL